MAPQIILK